MFGCLSTVSTIPQRTDSISPSDTGRSDGCAFLEDHEEDVIFLYSTPKTPSRKSKSERRSKKGRSRIEKPGRTSKRQLRTKSTKWAEVYLRVGRIGFDFEGGDEVTEYSWNRWQGSWQDQSGNSADIGGLFGQMVRSSYVDIRPTGEGFPVRIHCDEDGKMFTGFDVMNQKHLRVSRDLVGALVSNPDSSVWLGIGDS